MAFADFDAFRAAVNNPAHTSVVAKVGGIVSKSGTEYWWTAWDGVGLPEAGAVPTTGVTYTSTSAGGIVHPGTASRLVLVGAQTSGDPTSGRLRGVRGMLIDRLSATGGLSSNTISTQTTNLPTAALTRYTSGVGVMIGIECYSVTGFTTPPIVTASYTNTAGTAGRTATSIPLSNIPPISDEAFIILGLAAGDLGVLSVESVTVSVATGTAGNLGVTLFKPLGFLGGLGWQDSRDIVGWNSDYSDACLQLLISSFEAQDSQTARSAFLSFAEA